MKKGPKIILGVTTLIVVILVCLLLGHLVHRAALTAAVLDAQYQEMIFAVVQGKAQEQSTDHPMSRLYRDRREALMKAGYLKTRQFALRHSFESSNAAFAFLARFASRFPGVERQLRTTKPGEPPVFVVCARDFDLVAIKLWIMQNDTGK